MSKEKEQDIILKEDYDEEMFERSINGMSIMSFEVWKKEREKIAEYWRTLKEV